MFGMIKDSLFGASEEIKYKLLSTESKNGMSYEVCHYDAAKYASVSLEGQSFEQVSGWLVRSCSCTLEAAMNKVMGKTIPIITLFPRDVVVTRCLVARMQNPNSYRNEPPTLTEKE